MKNSSILYTTLLIFLATFSMGKAENLDATAKQILMGSSDYKLEDYSLETLIKSQKTESNLPDPSINGEYLFAPEKEDNRWAADISWELEWPGVYGARAAQAKKRIESARVNLRMQRADKLAEIKAQLIDYIFVILKLEVIDELNRNNDSIYTLSQKAAEQREISVLDLNKVRLEYANIRGVQAALMVEKETLETSLSEIYGTDCSHLLASLEKKFPEIEIPSASEINELKENAYSVAMARSEAEVMRQGKRVASMEALPNVSVGYKHAYEEDTHFNGALLGISIPIFSSRGKQQAAKAAITEAEFKVDAAMLSVESQVNKQIKKLSLLKSQIDEIESVLMHADHNAHLLSAYEHGLISMIDYLTERNYFTTATMEFLSLRREAALTQVMLKRY